MHFPLANGLTSVQIGKTDQASATTSEIASNSRKYFDYTNHAYTNMHALYYRIAHQAPTTKYYSNFITRYRDYFDLILIIYLIILR